MVLGTPTSETLRWRRTTIPSATDCLLTALWCKGYQTHACSEPDYLVTDYPPITSGNRCRTNRVCFCQLCALQGGLLRLLTKRRKTFPGFPQGKKRVCRLGISVLTKRRKTFPGFPRGKKRVCRLGISVLTKRRKTFPGFPRGKKRVWQLGISVLFGQRQERRRILCPQRFGESEASFAGVYISLLNSKRFSSTDGSSNASKTPRRR